MLGPLIGLLLLVFPYVCLHLLAFHCFCLHLLAFACICLPLELPSGAFRAAWESLGTPLWLPWRLLGASVARQDFESKTSKLAEAFDEN